MNLNTATRKQLIALIRKREPVIKESRRLVNSISRSMRRNESLDVIEKRRDRNIERIAHALDRGGIN